MFIVSDFWFFQTEAEKGAIKTKVKEFIARRNLHESESAGSSEAAQGSPSAAATSPGDQTPPANAGSTPPGETPSPEQHEPVVN